MRRYWLVSVVLAVLGLVAGALFRHFHDPADEANLANYARSAVHGAGLALAGWAAHLYLVSDRAAWMRRWPLVAELLARSVAMAIALATVAIGLETILYDHGINEPWLIDDYPKIVGLAFMTSIVVGAIYELTRLIGGRVLINVLLGRYRRPTREERVLLFLDLAGSTALAEEMGEVRVQELLTRFFFDIDEPIRAHRGEIHAYVGDEVIVTWPVGTKPHNRYIDCFFAIQDRIAERAERYREEFGRVPDFRAGLHTGPVVIGECGDSRRQVAYFGDTVNVTARLQAHCKEVGRALLVSGDLLRLLRPAPELIVQALGPTQLRGRAAAIDVYAVSRRPMADAEQAGYGI